MRILALRRARQMVALLALAMALANAASPVSLVVRAQGDGEEPPYPLLFGQRTEVIFPVVVRFIVGVNSVPDEIESIELEVQQENGPKRAFTVDPAVALIPELSGGVANQFLVTWWLDADLTLVPFEKVRYRWHVVVRGWDPVTSDGEFIYADPRAEAWRVAGRPPVLLHWHNPNLGGQVIWEEIMAAYGLLDRHTDSPPLFEFVIYDPDVELCESLPDPETGAMRPGLRVPGTEITYPCSPEAFARVYARTGMTFVQRQTYGLVELENLLIERMVRETYRQLWGAAEIPAWFETGLAMLYRLRPGIAALELARAAARTDTLYPLEALQKPLARDVPFGRQALWSAQAYTLVLALASRYGEGAPFDLARALADHPAGFAGALQALTGGDQEALWTAWLRWLFTDDAARAASWTPYLPAIPAPTVTPTASTVPPTPTPSRTRTPTVTPTEQVLGVPQPPVRIQTITPARQGTPTNTPLPPGSLPPATQPEPSAGSMQDDRRVWVIGATAIGALAMLLLAIVRTRRH